MSANNKIVHLENTDINFLDEAILKSSRKRSRILSHRSSEENLHEMFVIYNNETFIRPNKHLGKDESIFILKGSCDFFFFDISRLSWIDSQKFFINDLENYCCFWIYDQKQFKDFIGSKWWNFKKKVHNFRHNYGITERSSIGFNAYNINYFIATLLPEINNQTDPDCFIEHMTNNYYDKFSELKNQNFKDKVQNIWIRLF